MEAYVDEGRVEGLMFAANAISRRDYEALLGFLEKVCNVAAVLERGEVGRVCVTRCVCAGRWCMAVGGLCGSHGDMDRDQGIKKSSKLGLSLRFFPNPEGSTTNL